MESPQYIIVKLDRVEEPILAADPLETDIPPGSGSGISNAVTQYGADASGKTVTTAVLNNAIQAAGSRGKEASSTSRLESIKSETLSFPQAPPPISPLAPLYVLRGTAQTTRPTGINHLRT